MDFAALGLTVDSSGLDRGVKALDSLSAASSKTEDAAARLEKTFANVNARVANDNGFRRAAEAMKLTAYEARNLGFQVNDVATMLAMGASPMQVLASQGGQVLQILQGSAGGLKGFAAGVAALLTPMNLLAAATLAVGGGAAYMMFSTADATDAIEKHAERTKALKGAYDDVVKGQANLTKSSVAVQQALLEASKTDLEKKFKSIGASLSTALQGVRTADIVSGDFTFDAAITRFVDSVKAGQPHVLAFREEVARIANDTSLDAATRKNAASLLEMSQKAAEAEQALNGTADGIAHVGGMSAAQLASIAAFNAELSKLAGYSPDASKSIEAGRKVIEATQSYDKARLALREQLASGAIGGREYQAQLDLTRKTYEAAIPAIAGVTAEQKKLDDQIDATKGRLAGDRMSSRLGAIDADFARRVDDIRKMSATGATTQQIDGLIAKAKEYRDVQAKLAQQQDSFRSSGGKTDEELYASLIARAQGKVDMARVEAQTVGMTAEAIARARAEQELLNQAKVRDIDLTPTQIEQLKMLAGEEARYGDEARKRREQLSFEKDVTKGFITTLRQGLMSGQDAWQSFGNAAMSVLDKIINKLETQLVDALFTASSAGGGGFGGILSMLFSANGNAFGSTGVMAFANGGAFTNSIVTKPTLFPFANGTGLMGEAGPEAIMPLKRDGRGRLGVMSAGGGAPVSVTVGGTSIVITGDAGKEEIRQLRAEMAARDKAQAAQIRATVNDALSRGSIRR